MLHRNRRPKRNAAPVYRVSWKEKKSCQMRFFLKRNKSEKISPEMWRFLKRTISEQESHHIWWFVKRRKSEKNSHQMWKFLKRKITEKKIWWFLKRTSEKKHSKCESSWQGNFLKRTGIEYNRSWKGQIWKDFITSNVKVPEREIFWNKNHIIYDSSWQRKEVI